MKAQQKEINSKHMRNYRADHDESKDKEIQNVN